MKQCLIFLTESFPFRMGEEFIENEIKLLGCFDKVIVIPCNITKNESQTRQLPDWISVVRVDSYVGKTSIYAKIVKAVYMAKSLFSAPVRAEIALLINQKRFNCNTLQSSLKFYGFAEMTFTNVEKVLSKDDFSGMDRIVIYSYWLHLTAEVAVKLKNSLFMDQNVFAVSRAHGFDIYEYRFPGDYIPLRNYLLQNLDAVFPISQDGVEYLLERYPLYGSKIRLHRLGTSDHNYNLTSRRRSEFKIVSCSNLISIKRVNIIIEALSLFNGESIKWTHIGAGPLMSELKAIAENTLKNGIKWEFLGSMPNTDVINYYRKVGADLFVNVSESEGIPVSIMEAASFGIPTIATAVGGTSELVVNDVTGILLCKDFKPSELVEAIMRFVRMNDSEYRTICTRAREFWKMNFEADVNYSRFANELANMKDLKRV